jgi:hypothetical protein
MAPDLESLWEKFLIQQYCNRILEYHFWGVVGACESGIVKVVGGLGHLVKYPTERRLIIPLIPLPPLYYSGYRLPRPLG